MGINRTHLILMTILSKNNAMSAGTAISTEEIKQYCLNKHKAYEDYPFGEVPICYKLNGKIFAQLYCHFFN